MVNSSRSKNKNWEIGSIVNIGFMKGLKVISVKAVKDFLPDIYVLQSENSKQYEFIPHNGLYAI